MTKKSIRALMALLALAAVLTIFVYPTVNLPATKLIRPLMLVALLLTVNFAGMLLLAIQRMRRDVVAHASRPVPLVDLLCTRLC